MVLHGFDVDEESDKSIAEQLRDALAASSARVVDLFREWDTDGNGKVSREEFHKAMAALHFDVPAAEIDALFDAWDPDGSGLLELDELMQLLKRGGSLQPPPPRPSPQQYALTSAQPVQPAQPSAMPLTIGVLPLVAAPPKQANRPRLKPPPPCLEWDDAEGRYMSRAERLLGKQVFSPPEPECVPGLHAAALLSLLNRSCPSCHCIHVAHGPALYPRAPTVSFCE